MEDRDRMKILIAYDGSECAESAIDDLKRAGLPRRAEAVVLTIAEELIPAPTSIGGVATTFAKDLLEEEKDSLALANRARSRIQAFFPGWEILAEAGIGSPGSEIIARADEWRPDLIVVGSHGHTALGRMLLGSVSQKVVNEARCSVRVARGRIVEPDVPARIIVGVDGSEEADAAVEEIASRDWPVGSEVRIINSAWTIPAVGDPGTAVTLAEWIACETERVKKTVDGAAEKLGSAGLNVSIVVKEKEPKALLCGEAEDLRADSIFVGSRGMGRLERFLIGSVSLGVAARAHCSVEVVGKEQTLGNRHSQPAVHTCCDRAAHSFGECFELCRIERNKRSQSPPQRAAISEEIEQREEGDHRRHHE
ncbi:MAG: universal stress protein [Acidobacteria bacterium]|nr:universal stress protein [Acidobacteriota bacterium]